MPFPHVSLPLEDLGQCLARGRPAVSGRHKPHSGPGARGFLLVSLFTIFAHRSPVALLLSAALLATLFGCGQAPDPGEEEKDSKAAKVSRPVRVMVVDDEPFAKMLQRQWSARTQQKLVLKQISREELEDRTRLTADIVIYPPDLLGTLAQRGLIAPPPESVWANGDYDQTDVFDLQRNAQVRWGDQLYAFSFGSPLLVLMYRADLFAEAELEPPGTWDEYQSLAEKLDRSGLGDLAPSNDRVWTPLCEPLAAGWAGKTLLARAAPYASHPSQFSVLFDYTTMQPLIGGPPFVRALKELVAANQLGPEEATEITPKIARRRLLAGETAMALGWPSHAMSEAEPFEVRDGIEIGFAELPGSTTAYNFGEEEWTEHEQQGPVRVPLIGVAGKLGSVTWNARQPRDAAEIVMLLTGPEWSERLSPVSPDTTLFRESHVRTPELWTDQGLTLESSAIYAEVAMTGQSRPIDVPSIRIPGWQQYLQALDKAVYAALSGEQSAAEALAEAAQSWTAITAELGVDSQREAYTRSLGLEP